MMAWFDFLRAPDETPVTTVNVPLFPLHAVCFPGGVVPLRVFEARYLDMAAACLKNETPFGFCLIAAGNETGAPAEPCAVGTLADITHCEMEQLGILQIRVRGGRRFRLLAQTAQAGLIQAKVELLAEPEIPLPDRYQRLLPLLRRVVGELGERMPEPHAYDDAAWVGYRICEILPVQNLAKQKLLELEDPLARLEILEKFLEQRKLLG